jgi:hypothetical protein
MSRHQLYCDENYELTVGYQFSNETLYVQLLHTSDEGYRNEEVAEDIDFECELIKDDKENEFFKLTFAAMIYEVGRILKEYLTVQDLENWAGMDKTELFDHLLRERTDRKLCNEIYRWNMVGAKRNHVLRKVEKEVVE